LINERKIEEEFQVYLGLHKFEFVLFCFNVDKKNTKKGGLKAVWQGKQE
jgi:hypothetical protein